MTSDPYASIELAILYVDAILCEGERPTAWEMLTKSTKDGQPISPLEVCEIVRETFTPPIGSDVAKAAEMRAQMDDPLFLTYIAGRMGAT